MSDAPEQLPAARRVPVWPWRWLILFRLYDYLLCDAPVLFRIWIRHRAAFWQYIMKVEESRLVREAVLKGEAWRREPREAAPKRGAWRID